MAAAVLEKSPQILAHAVHGDASSFALLIEPLLDPAYRLAAVMLGDRAAADDAVQEASIKAWRNPTLAEVRRVEDFEGVVQLAIGFNGAGCLRAFFLTNPDRLVIDIQSLSGG